MELEFIDMIVNKGSEPLITWLEIPSSDSSDLLPLSSCTVDFEKLTPILWHDKDLHRPSAQTFVTYIFSQIVSI